MHSVRDIPWRFSSGINAFGIGESKFLKAGMELHSAQAKLERASQVKGLTGVEVNYPTHFREWTTKDLKAVTESLGLQIAAVNIRFDDPKWRKGAFTNPNAALRVEAINLVKSACDAAIDLGTSQLCLWLGQDGYKYSFEADYGSAWNWELDGIAKICEYAPDLIVTIEYKRKEPHMFYYIDSLGKTLLVIEKLKMPNLKVNVDFCHCLMVGEQLAQSIALVSSMGLLGNVHVNDGYGDWDDGAIPGSFRLWETIEALYYLRRYEYDGWLNFDMFPFPDDPIKVCEEGIRMVCWMTEVAEKIQEDVLKDIRAVADGPKALAYLRQLIGG